MFDSEFESAVSVDKACLAMKACEPFPPLAPLKQLAAPGLKANKDITKLLAGALMQWKVILALPLIPLQFLDKLHNFVAVRGE